VLIVSSGLYFTADALDANTNNSAPIPNKGRHFYLPFG